MSLEETINRIAGASLPANEEEAKFQAIGPILEDLGWDFRNINGDREVEFERAVGLSKGHKQAGRADIALMKITRSKKECVCLVEAKAPKAKLDNHVGQLVNYAFHEGVDICVLTNSRDWWLYLPREKGPISDRKFASLKIDDSSDRVADDLERFLGKENLIKGEAEVQAKVRLKALKNANSLTTELPVVWDKMKSDPDQGLVELISRRVSDKIGLSPDPKQVKALLHGESIPNVPNARNEQKHRSENRLAPILTPQPSRQNSRNKSSIPSYLTLFGEQHPVKLYVDILFKVVEVLHNMYKPRLLDILSANWDDKRLHISDRKETDRFTTRSSIPYWLNTHISAVNIIKKSHKMLDETGNNANDLRVFDEHRQELGIEGRLILPKSAKVGLALDSKHKPNNKQAPKPEPQSGGQRSRTSVIKPSYLVLFGEQHSVKRYRDVLFKVVETLHGIYTPRLLEILSENWGNANLHISNRKENKYFEPCDNTPYWIHAVANAAAMLKKSRKMLEETGNKASDLRVFDEHGRELTIKDRFVLPKSNNDPSPHRVGTPYVT